MDANRQVLVEEMKTDQCPSLAAVFPFAAAGAVTCLIDQGGPG